MATSSISLAAGVAVALAITVAGGPAAAVATAQPGFTSPSGHSRDGGHPRGRRDEPRRDRGPRGGDHPVGERPGGPRGGPDAAGDGGPGVVVVEPAPVVPNATPSLASPNATPSLATPNAAPSPAVPDVAAAVPARPVRTGRGGLDPVAVVPPLVSPRVVVGNGRTPTPVRARIEAPASPPPQAVAAAPLPAAPVVAPLVAPTPQTVTVVPGSPRFELPSPPPWTTVTPSWPSGTIFGIAGLLLAPIAGMWLGWRQARASKSAAQLVGSR